jgi:hypothetical protein
MSNRSFTRSWVQRDLQRGDLTCLRDFALFRDPRPDFAVIDRLYDRGFLTSTARGRNRITLKGWMAVLLRNTFARKEI